MILYTKEDIEQLIGAKSRVRLRVHWGGEDGEPVIHTPSEIIEERNRIIDESIDFNSYDLSDESERIKLIEEIFDLEKLFWDAAYIISEEDYKESVAERTEELTEHK